MNNQHGPRDEEDSVKREAVDRLNESNRVLHEARMLPKNRPLTAREIADVREAFNVYLKAHDVTGSQAAREMKYSPAVITEWSRDKYKGNVEGITHAANDWMERDSRRRMSKRPSDYVSTWVAETIRSIAYQADKRGMMAAIVAPAGAGKTKVLKVLAQEMRGVYHYCDQDGSGRETLAALAMDLGHRGIARSTRAELKRWVIGALTGTNRVIFLDEAHQLGKGVSFIRSIHDQAGVPIVMAGTADILTFVNDRTDGRGQFSSRCIQYNLLDEVRNIESPDSGRAKGKDLFSMEEIKAFFAMKKIRLTPDAMRLVWRLACLPNHGTLRLAEKLAEVALDMDSAAEVLTRESIIDALAILHNANARHLVTLTDRADRADAGAEKAKVA